MSNLSTLIAGPGGKEKGRMKEEAILAFLFKVHATTPRILAELLGMEHPANVYPVVNRMVKAQLIKRVRVPGSAIRAAVTAVMLDKSGAARASKLVPNAQHRYDTRPESVRAGQFEHDSMIALWAARWSQQGAVLMKTDYMRKRSELGKKEVDALFCMSGQWFALEFERSTKSKGERIAALRSAMNLGVHVLWVCDNEYIWNTISDLLNSHTWPELDSTAKNGVSSTKVRYASPWLTSKHLCVMATDALLAESATNVLERLQRAQLSRQTTARDTLDDDECWQFGPLRRDDQFWFTLYGQEAGKKCAAIVTSENGQDWVMTHDDWQRMGTATADVGVRTTVPQGSEVGAALRHAAIWTAVHRGFLCDPVSIEAYSK